MQYCVGFSFVVFCLFFWGGCFGLVLHLVFCLFVCLWWGVVCFVFWGVFAFRLSSKSIFSFWYAEFGCPYLPWSLVIIMTPTIKWGSMDLSVQTKTFTSGSGSLFVAGKLEEFLLPMAMCKMWVLGTSYTCFIQVCSFAAS